MKLDPATQHCHRDPDCHSTCPSSTYICVCVLPEWPFQLQISMTLQLKYLHQHVLPCLFICITEGGNQMSRLILSGQAPEVVCFWPVSGWSLLGPVSNTYSVISVQTTKVTWLFQPGGGQMSEKGSWTSQPT